MSFNKINLFFIIVITDYKFSLLDDSIDESPSPYYTWSEHSLPITDIWCGIGSFNTTRVLTSSLDHTCKVSLFIITLVNFHFHSIMNNL